MTEADREGEIPAEIEGGLGDVRVTRWQFIVAPLASLVVVACGGSRPNSGPAPTPAVTAANQSPGTYRSELSTSTDEVVGALGKLEERAGRRIFSGVMQFFRMGKTAAEVTEDVSWQPQALQEATRLGLAPTIILEPSDGLDMADLGTKIPQGYFAALRAAGVTAQAAGGVNALGRVVVSPEPIEGGWTGSSPALHYIHNVNVQLRALHAAFPEAGGSVLIDMNPHESDAIVAAIRAADHSTEPSAEPLQRQQITAVGIQAFPNAARVPFDAQGRADITGFFDPQAIQRVVAAFGNQPAWLNMGVPRSDQELGVEYTLAQRTAIATAVADGVGQLQHAGVPIQGINLFAGNTTGEGRDYRFVAGDEPALLAFADGMDALHIPISGFAIA